MAAKEAQIAVASGSQRLSGGLGHLRAGFYAQQSPAPSTMTSTTTGREFMSRGVTIAHEITQARAGWQAPGCARAPLIFVQAMRGASPLTSSSLRGPLLRMTMRRMPSPTPSASKVGVISTSRWSAGATAGKRSSHSIAAAA